MRKRLLRKSDQKVSGGLLTPSHKFRSSARRLVSSELRDEFGNFQILRLS